MDVALRVAEWVTMMHDGRVIVEGTPDEIRANETVHALYLGSRTMSEPLLAVEDLNGWYGTAHVLQGVSFSMGAEPVALIGRNGMGKSTLCLAIAGLLDGPSRLGAARRTRSCSASRPTRWRAPGIGYVPAGPAAVRVAHGRRAPGHRRPPLEGRVDPEARLRAVPAAGGAQERERDVAVRAASSRCSPSGERS